MKIFKETIRPDIDPVKFNYIIKAMLDTGDNLTEMDKIDLIVYPYLKKNQKELSGQVGVLYHEGLAAVALSAKYDGTLKRNIDSVFQNFLNNRKVLKGMNTHDQAQFVSIIA